MRSFTIGPNDAGQRLDKFILKAIPMLPKTLMYKYLRLKRIKVNGKRGEISQRLSVGDIIDAYINDEFFEKRPKNYDFLSASKTLNIVYEVVDDAHHTLAVGLNCAQLHIFAKVGVLLTYARSVE